jgi:hypothetical protein
VARRCAAGRERLKLAGINWQIYNEDNPAQPETLLYALLA